MRILYVVILLLVAILAVMFAAQNSAQIAINFFSLSATGSLSLILIITLSIGIAIGILIMAPSVFKRSIQSSGLRRKLHRSEKEKASMSEKIAAAKPAQEPNNEASGQGKAEDTSDK
jgi:lipopolysaccharide assembly protein A